MQKKTSSQPSRSSYQKLEQVIGCKWSVSVLQEIRKGTSRPGALERAIDGISTKVLSERLRKLAEYGLIQKHSFAEVPPRTEYSLTAAGTALTDILQQIRQLDQRIVNG